MTRKKIKLAWVENENSRTITLKKRRLGLVKKVRELTILCDVKACMILFTPNEVEPMVWPSVEAARGLLDHFFALPDIEKKKKETSLESYLKEKTKKVHEQLRKSRKKNMEYVIDQLMMQLCRGRRIADLNLNEIYKLLSFSKEKIMHFRKRLDLVQDPPLCEPPMYSSEAHSDEVRTTTYDIFMMRGGQGDEGAMNNDESAKRISIDTIRGNQSYYLFDQWVFPPSESPNPQVHQQIGVEMASYNENLDTRCYLPYQGSYHLYQGSGSNGNPNLEMQPIGPPMMTVGFRQESPPPPNEIIAGESNADAMSFDINRDCPSSNHHF